MKVVCISNSVSDLHESDYEHFSPRLKHLTIGKVYDAYNISDDSNPYIKKGNFIGTIDIFIKGDNAHDIWLPHYMFNLLDVIRDNKIDMILTK